MKFFLRGRERGKGGERQRGREKESFEPTHDLYLTL